VEEWKKNGRMEEKMEKKVEEWKKNINFKN